MSYRIAMHGPIAVCKIDGLFAAFSARRELSEHAQKVALFNPLASVIFCDEARVEISADALLWSAQATFTEGPARKGAAALVVTKETLPMWKRYAEAMRANGRLRSVHTSRERALEWAAEHAALLEADARWLASPGR